MYHKFLQIVKELRVRKGHLPQTSVHRSHLIGLNFHISTQCILCIIYCSHQLPSQLDLDRNSQFRYVQMASTSWVQESRLKH